MLDIKQIRQAAGLTQTEIAKNLGMSRSSGQRTVSQIEARRDWLLSSLVNYVNAAGAEAWLVVSVDGQELEFALK